MFVRSHPQRLLDASPEFQQDYYGWGSMIGSCRSYGVLATRIKSD